MQGGPGANVSALVNMVPLTPGLIEGKPIESDPDLLFGMQQTHQSLA